MSFSRLTSTSLVVLGLTIVGAVTSQAEAVTFSFDASAPTSTPFSLTSGGLTASFSSTDSFQVDATSGLFSFPSGLGDIFSVTGGSLTISFSTPVTQTISIPFGLEDAFSLNGSDTLTATANTSQTVTAGTTPNNLPLGEPEGVLFFKPTSAITSLTLTSANPFTIASVSVPEPMSLSLVGLGVAGMAALRRRSRQG